MNKFIENVNIYIKHYGIKQSFLALKLKMDPNKLSRILNNKQNIVLNDMESLAKALGKDLGYFFKDLKLKSIDYKETTSIAFHMGKSTPEMEELANTVFDFLEHIDIVLGMPKKLEKHSK